MYFKINIFNQNLILSFLFLFLFLFLLPFSSFAQNTVGVSPGAPKVEVKIANPINVDSINGFVKIILEGIIRIGIPIVALAIIYSGFLFVSAQGKPDQITKAKDAFLYTIIGAAVLLGSWAFAQVISDTVINLAK